MGFDRARVVEVYSKDAAGEERVGSGYLASEQVVLTADHVVAEIPALPTDLSGPEQCEARPLGLPDWLPARVIRHDKERDVALLRLATKPQLPAGSPAPGWGRLDGDEQVGCMAVGFPWAQARPDQVRDTEQLFAQLAPLTTVKAGRLAVNVVTAPPGLRPEGDSPWSGISGAALFAGPYLVGVVVVDPRRYGPDRLQATPISALAEDPGWWQAVGVGSVPELVGVGPRFRLAVTQDLSLVLAPPYRPLPAGLAFATAPVRLLLAEHGIVPFLGRQQLLDDLQAWCDPTPASLRVQVLTGGGGSGKTRLAAELCLRLQGAGWDAGFADATSPDGQTRLGFERPTLLVVDDADLQVQLSANVLSKLAVQPQRPALRLLLLARSQGAWWEQLTTQTDGLAEDYAAPPLSLQAGALTMQERQQHRDTAAAVFAAQLPGNHPSVEVPVLTDPVFTNPLLVHMSVLLTLLGQPVTNTPGGNPRTRVLQRLLDRERKRWTYSLPGAGLADLSDTVATQAVTVATLTSPNTRAETVELLQAIPDLADADLERRGRIADWLHQLYPGQAGYVAPLRPDLLAEQHVADTPDLPQVARNAYQHTTSTAQVVQLLAELTAARTRPTVLAALNEVLDDGLSELFDQALRAPTSPIPGLLAQALQVAPQPEAATRLVDRLPERSTALATLAVTLGDQVVQYYRTLAEANPSAYLPNLAMGLGNLGNRLAMVGRPEEALARTQEAVTIRRRLAEANPDAHLAALAGALSSLGIRLAEVGRPEEALAPAKEAITIYRTLAEANPNAYLPDLAGALTNLGEHLSRVGQHQQALAPAQEAVTIYRTVVEANPGVQLPNLAMALSNLGIRLAMVGRRDEALAPAQEAVTTYRTLAEANPDAYLPDLAMALDNLGNRLAMVGRPEEALAPAQEAVTIRRRLAEANPDAYLPDLATSLNNFGIRLTEVGQHQQALGPAQEAVTIRRRLAEANPDAYLADLATSLNNIGFVLSELSRPEEALAPTQEALAIYRRLAEANPDAYLADLAMALGNLGAVLSQLGQRQQPLAPAHEAVTIYRRLAETNPDAYLADLAMALSNLGLILSAVGRPEEALAPAQEAVTIYRTLAEANPNAHLAALAGALTNLREQLAAADRDEDVVEVQEELASVRKRMGDEEADSPS